MRLSLYAPWRLNITNKEKYGNKIIELAIDEGVLALKNGEPAPCAKIKCEDCDYGKSDSCGGSEYKFREWLNSEYVEPPVDWSKVAVDTPILVRDSEEEVWEKRYFAKYEDNTVCAWSGGATSWSATDKQDIVGWKMAKLAESEEK